MNDDATRGDDSSEHPAPVARAADPDLAPKRASRLLVADDETSLREMARTALAHRGYDVTLAADGQEAIERMMNAKAPFDGVLLDMTMPRLNGLETLRQCRARWPSVPVLLMSGNVDHPEADAAVRDGAHAVIRKPFGLARLYAAVEAMLEGRPVSPT